MENMQTPQENATQNMPAANAGPVPAVNPENTPKPKKKGGLFKIVLIVLIVAVLGGGAAWYFLGMPGLEEAPPSLELGGGKFQGQSLGEQLGSLVYDDNDVANYQAASGASFETSDKGVNYFYSSEDLTISDIKDSVIKPADGLQILIAFYSPGESELGTDECYYIYPEGPYVNTCEITDPNSFTIPAGRAFAIIASQEFEFDSSQLNDSGTLAGKNYINSYIGKTQGWLMIPLKGSGDINVAAEGSVWKMTGANSFEKVADKENPGLSGSHKIAWFDLGEPVAAPAGESTPEATTPEATTPEATTPEATEAESLTPEISPEVLEVGPIEAVQPSGETTTEDESTFMEIAPIGTETVTFLPSRPSTTTTTATSTSFAYIDNLEDQFTTDTSAWEEPFKGDLYGDIIDDTGTAVMAALKMTLAENTGPVQLTEVIFANHGYGSFPKQGGETLLSPTVNEIDKQPIDDYKNVAINSTDAILNYCNGYDSWSVYAYYMEGGVLYKRNLFQKKNLNFKTNGISSSTSTTFTKDNKVEDIELPAGTSVILTLEMEGLDHCADPKLKDEYGNEAVATSEANFTQLNFLKNDGTEFVIGTPAITNSETHDHWINWIDPVWAPLEFAPIAPIQMQFIPVSQDSDDSDSSSTNSGLMESMMSL